MTHNAGLKQFLCYIDGTQYSTENTVQKTQFIIHGYTVNKIQQTKNRIHHKTHAGLNALAVVQTQSITYTA